MRVILRNSHSSVIACLILPFLQLTKIFKEVKMGDLAALGRPQGNGLQLVGKTINKQS